MPQYLWNSSKVAIGAIATLLGILTAILTLCERFEDDFPIFVGPATTSPSGVAKGENLDWSNFLAKYKGQPVYADLHIWVDMADAGAASGCENDPFLPIEYENYFYVLWVQDKSGGLPCNPAKGLHQPELTHMIFAFETDQNVPAAAIITYPPNSNNVHSWTDRISGFFTITRKPYGDQQQYVLMPFPVDAKTRQSVLEEVNG
ncbi:hypothetical protein PhaeoP128_01196 [Phaeobacter gallaeciensis]|nr:hypothetical protein PhaeoP129_01196 [Phaeobacter gallaeciensis]ATF21947.1 hypothetical protein PhaeoP128_01196 [Phaeobacter gallaeciensis]